MIGKISVLLILINLKCYSQSTDFKIFLTSNKFTLIEIKYNAHSHTADIDAGYFYSPSNNYRAKMEMKAIVYDTSKVEHKKLLKNLKFKIKDTLLIYDWDLEEDATPYNVSAAKFKYDKNDSILTFYNVQDISRHANTNKPSMVTRKFKLNKIEKDRFVLLDLDFRDVKRTYLFKTVSIKK